MSKPKRPKIWRKVREKLRQMAKQTTLASADQARALRDVVRANTQLASNAKQVALGAASKRQQPQNCPRSR